MASTTGRSVEPFGRDQDTDGAAGPVRSRRRVAGAQIARVLRETEGSTGPLKVVEKLVKAA